MLSSIPQLKSVSVTIRNLVILMAGILVIAWIATHDPLFSGYAILVLILGIVSILLVLYRYMLGLYFIFFLSIFMIYIQRLIQSDFPLGIVYDFFIILTFLSLLIASKNSIWKSFLNPITWAFLLLMFYQLFEVFNLYGTFLAWGVSLRKGVYFLLFILAMQAVIAANGVKKITYTWMVFALIVALYGIYQQIFGLTDAEWNWVYSDPDRIGIYFVWGKMRKFSLLSDPSSFGIFMAFCGLACLVLAIRHPEMKKKLLFGAFALIMLISMNFSGTRTAFAMVGVGLLFYILLTMRSGKTLAIATGMIVLAGFLFFGPVSGWQINRIRSAFTPSEDPSMGIRDVKRTDNQPYILSHPIGGGLYTTSAYGLKYAPTHEFAGFDPDSGYLETAMETGWIGLIILLVFVFTITYRGISYFFSVDDPMLKTIVLMYLIPFFAISVAHYSQNALFAKPVDLLVMISLGFLAQIPHIGKISKTNPHSLTI